MPTRRAFAGSLAVAIVVLSMWAGGRTSKRVMTGTVAEFRVGESITLTSETTDPNGVTITLRETTVYEGDAAAITRGARVTVWYRSVWERHPVADRVRVPAP